MKNVFKSLELILQVTVYNIVFPGHPAVRVFVSHAGLLGTIEAVNCGVPMLTIPLYGDQPHNAECLVTAGVARKLNYQDIDKQSLLEVLSDLINNTK